LPEADVAEDAFFRLEDLSEHDPERLFVVGGDVVFDP
jgi:hypothetical protein